MPIAIITKEIHAVQSRQRLAPIHISADDRASGTVIVNVDGHGHARWRRAGQELGLALVVIPAIIFPAMTGRRLKIEFLPVGFAHVANIQVTGSRIETETPGIAEP